MRQKYQFEIADISTGRVLARFTLRDPFALALASRLGLDFRADDESITCHPLVLSFSRVRKPRKK